MKAKHWTTLAIVLSYAVAATTGFSQDGGVIGFENPDRSELDGLLLLDKVKNVGTAALTYVIGPLMGSFVSFKGWQMIGNSPRGEKGPGILVFICGIGMFALPKIITEILGVINN